MKINGKLYLILSTLGIIFLSIGIILLPVLLQTPQFRQGPNYSVIVNEGWVILNVFMSMFFAIFGLIIIIKFLFWIIAIIVGIVNKDIIDVSIITLAITIATIAIPLIHKIIAVKLFNEGE